MKNNNKHKPKTSGKNTAGNNAKLTADKTTDASTKPIAKSTTCNSTKSSEKSKARDNAKPCVAVAENTQQNNSSKLPDDENNCDAGCMAITFAEQRRILKEIDDPRYRAFFYFCCCTGVRACEALSIKCKDIDKRNKMINIKLTDTKTKKHQRKIPYLPELLKEVNMKNEYLFEDITDDGSKQYFYKLYKNMDLPLSRHSTRHTFVSMCDYVGINPETVQAWAGHTDLKMTTDTYTHKLNKGTSPFLVYVRKLKREHNAPPKKTNTAKKEMK